MQQVHGFTAVVELYLHLVDTCCHFNVRSSHCQVAVSTLFSLMSFMSMLLEVLLVKNIF